MIIFHANLAILITASVLSRKRTNTFKRQFSNRKLLIRKINLISKYITKNLHVQDELLHECGEVIGSWKRPAAATVGLTALPRKRWESPGNAATSLTAETLIQGK